MATVPIFSQDVRPAPEVPSVHGVADKDLDNIVSNVSAKYHRVLIHLGLSSNAIETLEIKHHTARVLFEDLIQWRKEKPRSSHCLWEDLLKAIEEGAENKIYAEEWRTELQERGIRTCEHLPQLKDWGDVTGSHLESTASTNSAAELTSHTRAGALPRRLRRVLPQQQQQQQQPVQKRSDKPSSSQDSFSLISIDSTRSIDLLEFSSSNHNPSRSSAECLSSQITPIRIGLQQKAPSPAIAQDDLKELHQCLIQYIQDTCRLVRHCESAMEHWHAAADYFQSAFKISGIAKVLGVGLFVGTLLMIAGLYRLVYHIYNRDPICENLDTLPIPMALIWFGMILMLVGMIGIILRTVIKDLENCYDSNLITDALNSMTVIDQLCLQFTKAHNAFLSQSNAIMQEYRINNRHEVMRQIFQSFRKDNNIHWTLEHFCSAQRQLEDSRAMISFLAADTVAKTNAEPLPRIYALSKCMRVVIIGCPFVAIILIVTWATVIWTWCDIMLRVTAIISSSLALLIYWAIICRIILRKMRFDWLGTIFRSLDILASYLIKAFRPLTQLFDSFDHPRTIDLVT